MLALGAGALLPAQAATASSGELAALAEHPCPERPPIQLHEPSDRVLRAAKRYRFRLVKLPEVKLRPPVAWRKADPFGSGPWRRRLHTLIWLDPLIAAYELRGDRRALGIARHIALDWISRHRSAKPKPSGLAWEDKRAGDRVLRIGYIARLSACAGLLREREARVLLRAVKQHAGFLAASETPPERTNHQSARDLALYLIAELFPFLEDAAEWRELGASRFEAGLAGLVHGPTAIQLEQSPSYQVMTETMLGTYLLHHPDPPSELLTLRERMRYAAWWLTMPDGRLWPTGDTPYRSTAPDYARAAPTRAHLAPTLAAGFGIVKGPDSYFATTAAFHRRSHKQIDDLGFELFGRGRPVITDSGRRGVAPGSRSAERYPGTARAHSTVTLGARWRSPKLGKFYGSALTAQGESDGWFAIEGRNLALVRAGVDHRRLFIYRPGELLVIRDRIEAPKHQRFSRWLQLAPGLRPQRKRRVISLRGRVRATVWDGKAKGSLAPRLHRGERRPLRGWYVAPGTGGKLRPRWALELPARAQRGTYVTTIAFGREAVTARSAGAEAVELCLPDGEIATVALAREGARLELDVERRADSYAECS